MNGLLILLLMSFSASANSQPSNSPERCYECRVKTNSSNMSCNKHRLRRAENPTFWPYPDVPPPKLPESPNPPAYKAGMNAKQYFEAFPT